MPTTYIVEGGVAEPENPEEPLHEYHDAIGELVDVDVVGLTGSGSRIQRVILADDADVSNVEDWLNASLRIKQ
jgi:hypothetical protein